MNLVFEKLTEDHAASLLPIWQDQEVIKYTYVKNINSFEDAQKKIQSFLSYSFGLLGPFVIKKGLDVIGLAAGMTPEENPTISEIFFHFAKMHWRKGYGSITVEFLLNEGFKNSNYNEIHAQAVTKNDASWKLLEKKGFRHKKLQQNAFRNEMDTYAYSIKREEYQAL